MINYRLVRQAAKEVAIDAAKLISVVTAFIGLIFGLAWTLYAGHYWVTPVFLATVALGMFTYYRYKELHARDLNEKEKVLEALRRSEDAAMQRSRLDTLNRRPSRYVDSLNTPYQ